MYMNTCYCRACRNVGSRKPQVSDEAVYQGLSIVSGLHCGAHIPIIVVRQSDCMISSPLSNNRCHRLANFNSL